MIRNAWKPTKYLFLSSLQPSTDLTLLIKTITIKVRSLCVVLMISPLVVRRTFYLVVNDRNAESLALLFLKPI